MGEAIIFVIFMLLSVLGLYKLFEFVRKIILKDMDIKAYLVCKIPKNCKDAEMFVRSLAADCEEITTAKGGAILILKDTDSETEKICRNTASQYSNIIVSDTLSLEGLLD